MPRMRVPFVEPFFAPNQSQFVRALADSAATVIGIGECAQDTMDDQLTSRMTRHHQVPSLVDVGVMTDAVRWVQDKV